MIKFFRKIRQRLLTENKFSKYLLYAIGEILLVVIGILIALQINMWSDNRKAKVQFEGFTEQLKVDVETAIKNAEVVAKFSLEQSTRTQNIIDYLLDPKSTVDFESYKEAMEMAGRYGIIVTNVGNLGKLLSGDLDDIYRNPALVLKVQELQTNLLVKEEVTDRFTQKLAIYQGQVIEFSNRMELANYGKQGDDSWIYDVEMLRKAPQFMENIKNLQFYYRVYSNFGNAIAQDLEKFKEHLDTLK
ncbi:MAG: DUF6090 family protein [Maribacter arcticus]|uniref:DUF6090 family protein n=1 Tax=Maribacter arcticus TaxID=561365 RepID=UPI003002FC59